MLVTPKVFSLHRTRTTEHGDVSGDKALAGTFSNIFPHPAMLERGRGRTTKKMRRMVKWLQEDLRKIETRCGLGFRKAQAKVDTRWFCWKDEEGGEIDCHRGA